MHATLPALATRRLAHLSTARDARARSRRLRAELATYRSPAERAELGALLARASDDDTELVEQAARGLAA